jgi:hypothetical protein
MKQMNCEGSDQMAERSNPQKNPKRKSSSKTSLPPLVSNANSQEVSEDPQAPLRNQQILHLQSLVGNQSVMRVLTDKGQLSPTKSRKPKDNSPATEFGETHQDELSEGIPYLQTSSIQRQEDTPSSETGSTSGSEAPAATTSGELIVPDDSTEVGEGQMRRSDFIAQLEPLVIETTKQALEGTLLAMMGYPGMDSLLAEYKRKSSSELEQDIKQQVPGAREAKTAASLIPMVQRQVHQSVTEWVSTGDISDLLQDVAGDEEGFLSFKLNEGADTPLDANPDAMRRQIGEGQALEPDVKSRMEGAFGTSFSDVKIHHSSAAGKLAQDMDAKAFTIGSDIAFGSGDYQPGSLVGDALVAHELAHVVQQRGGNATVAPKNRVAQPNEAVEQDADRSALGVIMRLYSGGREMLGILGENFFPTLQEGQQLRHKSCGSSKSKEQQEIERLAKLQHEHLEQKRKAKEAELKKQQEEDAKKKGLPPPKTDPKVDMDEVIKEDSKKNALQPSPTDPWTKLAPADQTKWQNRATAAWNKLMQSIKGTELENVMKGKGGVFKPEEILKQGAYAHQDGNNLGYGMTFVTDVEADPKNGWPMLAHEMGGHFEYGNTYAWQIYHQVKQYLTEAERKQLESSDQLAQDYYTYSYPETEIYAALRQRRYDVPEDPKAKVPQHGGMKPDQNIEIRLKVIKDSYHPAMAKAVLIHLKQKIDANAEILPRDKQYFVDQVKKHVGINL